MTIMLDTDKVLQILDNIKKHSEYYIYIYIYIYLLHNADSFWYRTKGYKVKIWDTVHGSPKAIHEGLVEHNKMMNHTQQNYTLFSSETPNVVLKLTKFLNDPCNRKSLITLVNSGQTIYFPRNWFYRD
jgi:protein involved in ribonucleotide reduction